jgi:germination protein M
LAKKTTAIAITVLASSVYLSGCGLFSVGKKDKIDPPQNISYTKQSEQVTSKNMDAKATKNSVMTELYLVDRNGYVVSKTLPLPKSTSVAKQALQYLVNGGPVEDMLPNGFRAVLPVNTEVNLNIKDGTAIADFSSEFKNYKAEDEERILQSITWTLTQFNSIKNVEIQVNGKPLTEMPVNGTPINPDGLSRADGINVDTSGVADITNTHPLTVYYLAQNGKNYYYVPVTKRVPNSQTDDISAAVNELIKGPDLQSSLVSGFLPDAALVSKPKVVNGNVTLNFNKSILDNFDHKMISDDVLNALVLSLTEQQGIESVTVEVDGNTHLVNEEGKSLTKPVTRPQKVNTGSF